jgi:hypothetical protein
MPTRRRSWSAERLAGNLRRDGLGGRRELRQDGRGASRGQHPPPRALVILLDSPSARTGPVHRGIWSWPVEATCSKRSSCGGTRVIPDGGHQIPAVRAAVAAPPESPRGSARAPLLAPGSSSPAARLCSQRSSPPGARPPRCASRRERIHPHGIHRLHAVRPNASRRGVCSLERTVDAESY